MDRVAGAGVAKGVDALILADGACWRIGHLLHDATQPLQWLPDGQMALRQIGAVLQRRRPSRLHLVGHGRPGALHLGGHWITRADLLAHSAELAQWRVDEIALWGCEIDQDPSFVAVLEELTGARVYASSGVIDRDHHRLRHRASGVELGGESIVPEAYWSAWGHRLGVVAFTPNQLYAISDSTTSKITLGSLVQNAVISQADPFPGVETLGNDLFTISSSNDLLVSVTLSDGTAISGEIQRRVTTGNLVQGLVIFEDVNGDGNVPQGGEDLGRNFLLVREGQESAFSSGSEYSTNSANSDSLADDLNAFLAADGGNQATALPIASITNVSVSEGDPGDPARYAVVEFSLSIDASDNLGVFFTPSLARDTSGVNPGTVNTGSAPDDGSGDDATGIEYFDVSGSVWLDASDGVPVGPGSNSVRVTRSSRERKQF